MIAAPFVTISRQAGAGGHGLARALLEELGGRPEPIWEGWQVFNEELLRRVAEDSRFDAPKWRAEIEAFLSRHPAGTPPRDEALVNVFAALRATAARGKVVIVGRGGCCLTSDLPGGVHVRLVASKDSRLRALGRLLDVPEREAGKELEKRDSSRAKLLRSHFGKDIEDPLLYDAVFNSDRLGAGAMAKLLVGLIREQAGLRASAIG